MCVKNGVKTFFIIFQTVKTNQPITFISGQNVYKSLEVFKAFPTPHQIANVIKDNNVDDLNSLRAMKVDIPFSKLL